MAAPGTQVDPGTMSKQELVKYAHETEQLVFPGLTQDQRDTLKPIWEALIQRVEGGNGNGNRGF